MTASIGRSPRRGSSAASRRSIKALRRYFNENPIAPRAAERYASLTMFLFQEADGIPVLFPSGDLDLYNVDDFEAALAKLESLHPSAVLVSLERATFVCVHAFGIVAARAQRAAKHGQRLVLVCPNGSFHRKILRLLQFPTDVAYSIEEALVHLRRREGAVAQT